MEKNQSATNISSLKAKPGKYLTFELGEEEYGLEILTVKEIIGLIKITPVPKVPEHVKGIINLRGKVIPVINLRLKFEMPDIEPTEESCIIVINIEEEMIGILIDRVKDVLDIKQENIEPPPDFGANVSTEYILGMCKAEDNVKILLDIRRVIGGDLKISSEAEEDKAE